MRYMMLVILPKDSPSETGTLPDIEVVGQMSKYNEDLAKAGVLVGLDGLHPTSKGTRITFPKGNATAVDGPFTEANEVFGGYWIIDVASREEAIAWALKAPAGTGTIEVRKIFEMSDFPTDIQEAGDSEIVREAIKA